jgi:NAD(P)-dependent dehydrogenase (short-subunit alcohol dehydrogenase family)
MTRLAVVTGASQGVGLELCERLGAREWKVVGLARQPRGLAAAIERHAGRVFYKPLDVTRASAVKEAFRAIGAEHGSIDLLVNNAAVFQMKEFSAYSAADVDSIIDTNLKGAIFCTLEALGNMKSGARIVNIASVAATHGIKHQALYCASKFGMDGFAEALNQELVDRGISITTICPGGIDTPLWNAQNPYPGDIAKVLASGDVASLVEYVANLPERVVLKRLTLFPSNEWH